MAKRLTAIFTVILAGGFAASTPPPVYAQQHRHHATHKGWSGDYDEHHQWHDKYWYMDNRPSYAKQQHHEWSDDRDAKHRGNEREPGNVHPE